MKIRQEAAGLNFIDVYHRTGLYPKPLPFVLGVEARVSSKPSATEVTHVKMGDRVAYAGPIGGYAEERLMGVELRRQAPDDIASEQAAAMMLKGITAQMLLRTVPSRGKAGDFAARSMPRQAASA